VDARLRGSEDRTLTHGYAATRHAAMQSTTVTSTYPWKFFSIASTTRGSTNYATSTEYIFNGDALLSTVDQAFKNGAATGTAACAMCTPIILAQRMS
jgi:hypothetical protein